MRLHIVIFLSVYFAAFFGIAVLWRNQVVRQKTGINAFKLNQKNGAESITNRYFKILPVFSIFVFVIFAAFPHIYTLLGPIDLLNVVYIRWIGALIMTAALIWVIVAQSQMGTSWRIGIDHESNTPFVQRGLFSLSRNPIFVGVIFISFGFFLVLPNAITLAILALDIALIQVQVAMEEQFLMQQHGEQYKEYCQKVRRWI